MAGAKIIGRISWNPKGYAFVMREQAGPDIFVPFEGLNGAIDGDLVEVRVRANKKGPRGHVVSILQRAVTTLSGRYRRTKKWGLIEPFKPFPYKIIIPLGSEAGAGQDDTVVVMINPPAVVKRVGSVTAKVVQYLEFPDNVGEDLMSVARTHGIPWLFTREVEEEAGSASVIDMDKGLAERRDLRDRILFTIDGVKAKDFDDAVGIERCDDGTFLLTVAIADVAHVVRPGTILDREALNRSFSVYFPELAIPMLPEVLSNGTLSLKPGEDRLALVVEVNLGKRGRTIGYDCYEAVIRSRARLTYESLNPFLDGHAPPPVKDMGVLDRIISLEKMARHLYARRKARGGLDFDLAEVSVGLDDKGQVDSVGRSVRGKSERLIEEAMLCANHTVCSFLQDHGMPVLFRTHEEPCEEGLIELVETLGEIGLEKTLLSRLAGVIKTGKNPGKMLQMVADAYLGDPLENFVHQHILRSLARARYSHEDAGHFGLASKGYLHFTSPIRRYPDIIIHRLVKQALKGSRLSRDEHSKWKKYLKYIGPDVSKREEVTDQAMLDVVKLKTAQYMSRHIGDGFTGVVTSILAFGMFVEIFEPPVDGLVSASDMGRARIAPGRHIRMKNRVISMGDVVDVRLVRVDKVRGLLDLELV